jgi:hypothetical protein
MGGLAGGDCSDRMCPYELAWVDSPARDGSTHNYAECAAKGICDRLTGLCECFEGYEGKGCGRQVCEADCSGHGTCEFMNELTFGTVYNEFYDGLSDGTRSVGVGGVIPSKDMSWDSERARTCVCDAGFSGLSCLDRMCPVGNDILDTRSNLNINAVDQVQRIALYVGKRDQIDLFKTTIDAEDFMAQTFALTFTSKLNESYTTLPISLGTIAGTPAGSDYTTLNGAVEAALLSLPNKVINGVTVTSAAQVAAWDDTVSGAATTDKQEFNVGRGIVMDITFTGTSVEGNQNLIEVSANPCGAGCSPRIDGLDLQSYFVDNRTNSFVMQTQAADFNSFECGRRGKCDLDTGICDCFEGYTSEACTTMSSLV